ncbi:ABC transporter permease [Allochromatium palmeri]|uniref:ABC transporter permease subunit n=1 Tax=Allochromatium palmeri TaxID=231048 RepID=A0A6N8ED34_9GAMM|nr:iron ABC transporter permease [Allochromatium palmeri]MTW20819.1 ABC transporter permease subunit [Allochromatium palmeri]
MEVALSHRPSAAAPPSSRRALWRRPGFAPGLLIGALALLLALPVLVVLGSVLRPAGEVWRHLATTVLPDYVANSLILMLGVGIGTLLIGVGTAWLTTLCRFPGRRLFEWALLLPMAMPAYLIAYTYTGLLDYAGPVQTLLRDWTGWSYGDYWFPAIRSLPGAMLMLSLVLYPYVYLLARAAFLSQSVAVLEVGRTLGQGPWGTFWRVALPLARPAIVAGVTLALMETLADYGTVQYFGVATFSTGIFRVWLGQDEPVAAAQLAALLLVFVLTLILIERGSRRRARYHHSGQRHQPIRRYPLRGWAAFGALLVCLLPLLLGFLVPAGQLAVWSWSRAATGFDARFLSLTLNSLGLAGAAALLALVVALILAYAQRLVPTPLVRSSARLAGMGYAVPGAVIAIGVMLPLAWLDNALDGWMRSTFGLSTGLLFSGTLFALLFAYLARFLSVALQTVESGLTRIRPAMDEAARSLGQRPAQVLWRVHVPLLRGSLLTALLLVFVDVIKELPATLALRPFNFDTLAVRAYELASDERLADAGPAALTIVLAGLVPVVLLSRSIARSRHVQSI